MKIKWFDNGKLIRHPSLGSSYQVIWATDQEMFLRQIFSGQEDVYKNNGQWDYCNSSLDILEKVVE